MGKDYKQVKVNFLPEELIELKKMAAQDGVTAATFIRIKLGIDSELNKVKPRNMKQVYCQKVPYSITYHLSKISTNLNQIAERCNIKKSVDQQTLNELRFSQK